METSMMARVNRERVLLVGGQRALVMQLAHPAVAAGVAAHSDFPARAMSRLRRTLDLSLTLIYGEPDEAQTALETIRAVHDRVAGVSGGRRYRADDPDLLLWVNATLIDTTLLVYERFVRRLSDGERRRYYAETVGSAEAFGIPRDLIPPDLDSFGMYMRAMLDGPELRATPESRQLVRDVLRPPLPLPFRPPTAVVRRITLPLLPARIRALFGLRAGFLSHATLRLASRTSKLTLPFLPSVVREFSVARRAA